MKLSNGQWVLVTFLTLAFVVWGLSVNHNDAHFRAYQVETKELRRQTRKAVRGKYTPDMTAHDRRWVWNETYDEVRKQRVRAGVVVRPIRLRILEVLGLVLGCLAIAGFLAWNFGRGWSFSVK